MEEKITFFKNNPALWDEQLDRLREQLPVAAVISTESGQGSTVHIKGQVL